MPAMPAMPSSPAAQVQQAQHSNPVIPPAEQPRQQPQPPQPQQGNRDVRMNANGNMAAFDGDDDDENLNQDWLDKMYTLCRMGILLSIVWLYSTTGRFLMFLAFMVVVFLYQNGVFQYFAWNRNNAGKQLAFRLHVTTQSIENIMLQLM